MRWLKPIFIIALGGYFLVALAACALQERFVYFPDSSPATLPEGLPISEVNIETADGEVLVGWQMQAEPGCPTLLMFHGNGGHLEQAVWQYRRIHLAGAGMLAVSWRGYAGSTGRPSQAGLFADAEAAYAFLEDAGFETNQIVIHGFSLGTGPSTRLAGMVQAKAVILEAPYYSALRVAQEKIPFLPMGMIFNHPYRSDLFIPAVEEPILIAHGSADSVIPVQHSADLAERASAPVTRVVFDGSEHNTLVRDGLYETAIWPFLKPLYADCAFGEDLEDVPS